MLLRPEKKKKDRERRWEMAVIIEEGWDETQLELRTINESHGKPPRLLLHTISPIYSSPAEWLNMQNGAN